MRILTIANVPPNPNSGAAGTDYRTNEAFRELGHDVDEVWKDDLGAEYISHPNLHSLLEQPRRYRAAVKRSLENHDYDLVIIDQPPGYLAARYLRKNNFPGVVLSRSHGVELRVHEVVSGWERKIGRRAAGKPFLTGALRRLLDRQWTASVNAFDGVVVSSNLDKKYLMSQLGSESSNVLVNVQGVAQHFIDVPASASTCESARQDRLLYVGQYAFVKGPMFVADIFNGVLRSHANARATWVTSKAMHETAKSMIDPAIIDRVDFQDWVSQEELLDIFDSHGVFVFPSLYEGFGKAPFEAMARGLTVVSSDEGGMRDHIVNDINGYLCPVGDVDAFVDRIGQLINPESRARAIGNQAANDVKKFTWRNCAQSILDFAESLRRPNS